jgi:hypothetical protein
MIGQVTRADVGVDDDGSLVPAQGEASTDGGAGGGFTSTPPDVTAIILAEGGTTLKCKRRKRGTWPISGFRLLALFERKWRRYPLKAGDVQLVT